MASLLTLARPGRPALRPELPDGYRMRPCHPGDVEELGRLYFSSYPPGVASADEAEAVSDIRAAFAGEYGALWPAASPVVSDAERRIVAAVQVVERAPWPDTPDCPFVIELFTAPAHRRRGLARALLLAAVDATGGAPLALRVAADNTPAVRLYEALGFEPIREVA